jgi:hypothetical protein
VTAAMEVTLRDLQWRVYSTKTVVLVADAPPHGLGEYGDGFPNGDPNGHDPLVIAREMASRGIGIVSSFRHHIRPLLTKNSSWSHASQISQATRCVSVLPPRSQKLTPSQYGIEFFQAITRITSGLMLPLTTADLLANAIIGSVLENLDMESLVRRECSFSSSETMR